MIKAGAWHRQGAGRVRSVGDPDDHVKIVVEPGAPASDRDGALWMMGRVVTFARFE
jgi:hypothetical protein